MSLNFHQSNGLVEHAIQTVKCTLKNAKLPNEDHFLSMLFLNTQPDENGLSPAHKLFKGVSTTFLLVYFLDLNESTCQTRENVFFRFKSSVCSRENQILEFYIFKFHDVIKCLSIKQEIHFTE